MKSGNLFSQNYEAACEDVRDCVAAFRRQGHKTVAALFELARAGGLSHRRVHTLFFRERDAQIGDEERQQIRAAAIRTHRDLAKRHRALAAANEAIADEKENNNPLLVRETPNDNGVVEGKTCRAQA